ncbi:MAG: hypothetical protein Q7S74_06890, partial [Nanoarchaeota archaeon]|nr:hypothetical protein [Nanoarchaeota archaeon]
RDLGKSSTQNNQVNQVANTLPNIDTTGKSKEDVYFELYYTCQKTCFDVSDSEFLKCTARCTTETVDKYTFIYGGAPVQESETDFVAKLNLENSKKYSCIQGCSAETTNCIKGCSGQGIDCMQKCPAQNFSQVISCQKVCLS